MKTIVVPDIHGRDFWKGLKTKYKDFNGNIIFLGDYCDPYPNENIKWVDVIKNFKEILDFAKSNNNVILLIGNHDLHYIYTNFNKASRFSYEHSNELNKLYNDNIDLFKIVHYDEQNDILYSHAGVLKYWLKTHNIKINQINNLLYKKPEKLWEVSFHRGGCHNYGSPIWADIREHFDSKDNINNHTIQIIGHTQLKKDYEIIKDTIYCIDSKQLFIVNNRDVKQLNEKL